MDLESEQFEPGKGKMRDNYTILDFLGAGSYGEVRKCVYSEDAPALNDIVDDYPPISYYK